MRFALALLALIVFGACSADQGRPPGRPGGQFFLDDQLGGSTRTVFVLVVDDTPTDEGKELRAMAVAALRFALHRHVDETWGSCASPDPAQDHPTNIRVLVVFPSAPDPEAVSSSVTLPELAWLSKVTTHAEVEPVVLAAEAALGSRLAQPGESYRPLHATKRAVELLTGGRPAEGKAEVEIASWLAGGGGVRPLVASGRDDEGTEPISEVAGGWTQSQTPGFGFDIQVVGPFGAVSQTCEAFDSKSQTRLFEWAKAVHARAWSWPCQSKTDWETILEGGACDGFGQCVPARDIAISAGRAACRVWVDQPDLAGCGAEKGWVDPGGKPTYVSVYGVDARRCEVRQLEGAALTACRETLPCEGCGSGWCVTDDPAIIAPAICLASQRPTPFRWIGGAMVDALARHIVCDTEN